MKNYKNIRKGGLWTIFFGVLMLIFGFIAIITDFFKELYIAILIVGIALILSGISLLFFNKSHTKRAKIVIVFNIACFVIFFIGVLFKYLHLPFSSILIIIGGFILAFTSGPLIFINKFEKWKFYARSSKNALFLSLSDMIGKAGLVTGVLFKLMSFPGAYTLLVIGGVSFLISYLIWSWEFQKEVVLRKNAEDSLNKSLEDIKKQKIKIENIHKEISQSIDYAQRIQASLLPENNMLGDKVSDHFVLFKPKDIVSGDFYWWDSIEGQTIITAADCTGHGVPGAFMSMLGVSFLREVVTKEYITNPGVILRKVRKEVIKSLKQESKNLKQQDGMDMAMISINHDTNILQFSGANNPLYIISDKDVDIQTINTEVKRFNTDHKNKFLLEIKPDKMPIGIYQKMDRFTCHEIKVKKGDLIYMFSDGYADQFGGPKGKKFMYKQFKNILLENAHKSMYEQKEILNKTFEKWKGNLDQIDDVLVLGLKI